jgi:hypothetical protein
MVTRPAKSSYVVELTSAPYRAPTDHHYDSFAKAARGVSRAERAIRRQSHELAEFAEAAFTTRVNSPFTFVP